MTNHEPPSGYNLPPGCFEHDIDAYFGEGRPLPNRKEPNK